MVFFKQQVKLYFGKLIQIHALSLSLQDKGDLRLHE